MGMLHNRFCAIFASFPHSLFHLNMNLYVLPFSNVWKCRICSVNEGWTECGGSTAVKVLRYKPEGRWFDPRLCRWIFHWHKILPIALMPWGWLSLEQNWVPGVFPGGKGGRCVRLTTYHHPVPLSRNLGTLTFWNPLGLFRPVMGLLYLYLNRMWVSQFRT